MVRSLVPLLLLVAAGCAQTPAGRARAANQAATEQERLQHLLAGLTPGKPVSCVNQTDLRSANVEGYGSTLVYRVARNRVYTTDAPGCEGVGRRDDILVTVSPTGQLCRGDIAHTRDRVSHFETGSCGLGDFILYRRAK